MHKLPFVVSSLSSTRPLELLYTDVWGPTKILSVNGFRYYVSFVDHYTKYIWLFPLKQKSEISTIFTKFKTLVEKQFNSSILTVYSDSGGEFETLKSFFEFHGIQHLKTPPHTSEHNAVAERRHRSIVETGKTLLHQASMPLHFWPYAFETAVYILNRLPTPVLQNKSPFEMLFQQPPNYTKLKTFGCLCFPWLKPYTAHKLEPKSAPCVFLGYSKHQSAYLCLNPTTQRVYTSRHVLFDENHFPFQHSSDTSASSLTALAQLDPISYLPVTSTVPQAPIHIHPIQVNEQPSPPSAVHLSDVSNPSQVTHTPLPSHSTAITSIPIAPVKTQRTHSMITRSQNNIFKPKKLFTATKHPLPSTVEPTSATQAIKSPEWKVAMQQELVALHHNKTWELVPPPADRTIVGVNRCSESKET